MAVMNAYETSTTVEIAGEVRIAGVPFAPGTEVDVLISPKRKDADEFLKEWQRLCEELRGQPQSSSVSDDVIEQEIDDYRHG